MMIVALWCIQAKPSDRRPMDKVLEMLEDLQMPNQPDLYAQDVSDDRTGSSLYSSGTSVTDTKEPN